ncbi:MAG: potassium-transporting ATPase subunit KdpC [Clostridia bacterium]|nr:potassium-transporting ATPase subunit KdpC [Clostridia bacterium]
MKTAKTLGRAALFLLIFTVICGVLYTAVVTAVAQVAFPDQANGSVVTVDGKTYGSALLGQEFTGGEYLWGRIMKLDTETFTDESGNPVMYAWASNLSPASPEYGELVAQRVEKLRAANPAMGDAPIPVDLVTCSGSGLDPAISPAAAEYQVSRVAAARGVGEDKVRAVIKEYTSGRFLFLFGEPTVNVLKVNLALDGILKG